MMKTKFYALCSFLTVAMSGCDNEYDGTGIRTQIARSHRPGESLADLDRSFAKP